MLVNKFFTLAGVFVVAKIADRAYDREVRNFYLNNSTGIPYFENEETLGSNALFVDSLRTELPPISDNGCTWHEW